MTDCRMCGDDSACRETRVDGEPVALCQSCRGLLERNGRVDRSATVGSE